MHANAADLTPEAKRSIAAYLADSPSPRDPPPVTGDAEAGKAKLAELKAKDPGAYCGTCHGEDGNSPSPAFPRIAGQYEDYMVKALEDYKSGNRGGGNAALMNGIAVKLSEREIHDLAAYYASQKPALAVVDY